MVPVRLLPRGADTPSPTFHSAEAPCDLIRVCYGAFYVSKRPSRVCTDILADEAVAMLATRLAGPSVANEIGGTQRHKDLPTCKHYKLSTRTLISAGPRARRVAFLIWPAFLIGKREPYTNPTLSL